MYLDRSETRGVAQLGSASALGAEGRRFKSCHPDRTSTRTDMQGAHAVKSTVEKLSPTRVRINVEVPFTELQPDFDRAYKQLAKQVRLPGFRPGQGAREVARGADRSRSHARPGRQRCGARPLQRGGDELGRPAAGPARDRDHQEGVRRGPGVHRRGRHPSRDHHPRSGGADDHRRSDRGDRRGRRRRVAVAARPVRHADRCRAAGTERRLRVDRPVGHRRRRGGARRPRPRGCPTRSAPAS